ncbi:phage tail protein [Anaerococcus tetradius]|uniref:Phage minor structural protein, N-terminal domain protein n=1 Tax=Anaerococcus tetradius ATCC 35098 TaxID=525255 RepID=C2CFW3_9FIRM|nr:phage tail protein [Anaerococcus tetradius]EEI83491.1 phage minor structural protein, N-terminal domain protein [Anaerococcus tetradius ATCC 35098]
MLVYKNDVDEQFVFSYYRNLYFDVGINELISPVFEIPKEYRHLFEVESQIIEDGQLYDIKNIEPFYDGYKVECRQAVYTLQAQFNKSLNFPYQTFENILKRILPQGWSYKIVGNLKERRTITADHKDSWQVFNEAIKKFNYEYKINSSKQEIIVGKELGTDRGAYFMDDFNIDDKDITEESFEFATRIIPEGMNGLKINQINEGKDYLEDKSYSWKTITYHWKDERYTNIENLKEAAAEKLKALSRPRMTIKLKVKDLSEAVGVYAQKYEVGDFVYLIDKDRKTKERFRITAGRFYPSKPFENEISLTNRPVDIVDDVKETIELTKEMWEETRIKFETTEEAIKSSVETARRHTDESFKIYKTEREETDSKIYESITESTTYVDPKTGQTKPIVEKQFEMVKTIDGINVSISDMGKELSELSVKGDKISATVSDNYKSLESEISVQADSISKKVSKGKIISEINQSPEQVKIKASKIDLMGNVSVRGDFTTYDSSDNVGIELKYNDIRWRDNRWENKTFGVINVSEKVLRRGEYSFMIGHYPTSQLSISYYDNNYAGYFPYITFDRWNYTGDGGREHPIVLNEGVYMDEFHKLFLGDIVFETNIDGELKIHHKSRNAGVKIDSIAIYAYYASGGRDVNKEIARF